MPRGHYLRRPRRSHGGRPYFECERELAALRPAPEPLHDVSRGEERLAAEVALHKLKGFPLPSEVATILEARCRSILDRLARH